MSSTKEILKYTLKGGFYGCLGSAFLFFIGLATDKFSRKSAFLDPSKASLWVITMAPIVLGLFTGCIWGLTKKESHQDDVYEPLASVNPRRTSHANIQGQEASGPVITSTTFTSVADTSTADQLNRGTADQLPHSLSSEYLARSEMLKG